MESVHVYGVWHSGRWKIKKHINEGHDRSYAANKMKNFLMTSKVRAKYFRI